MKSVKRLTGWWGLLGAGLLVGCVQTTHKVETRHEIDPIQVTVDINLKVERELDEFFAELDEQSGLIELKGETE